MNPPECNFHLALTCAGGGTAGAYIAGVLDYLFETLDQWEKAKQKNPDLPQHKVTIEVIGGNSAGSMSTALGILNLYKNKDYVPVQQPSEAMTGNLLYDSWVLLNNVGEGKILNTLLDTDDLKREKRFVSVLNIKGIDGIANGAANQKIVDRGLPNYMADDFEFLLSLANLRGIHFPIDFKSNELDENSGIDHGIMQHKLIAHFETKVPKDASHRLQFSPGEDQMVKLLMKCAKSSGSLPFIFAPRHFSAKDFPDGYIEYSVNKFTLMGAEDRIQKAILKKHYQDFATVDGGIFNNEPFGEVSYILDQKTPKGGNKRLLLIDPYPTFKNEKTGESMKKMELLKLLKTLYEALRGQGLFKIKELLDDQKEATDDSLLYKGMIFPSVGLFPREDLLPTNKDLASQPVEGLAGFISKKFRDRDFFLGRYNCQVFLHRYFILSPKDEGHELLKQKYTQIKDKFQFNDVAAQRLPIIPDMTFFNASHKMITVNKSGKEPFEIADTNERQVFLSLARDCKIDKSEVKQYQSKIRKRVRLLVLFTRRELWNSLKKYLTSKWYLTLLNGLLVISLLILALPALIVLFPIYLAIPWLIARRAVSVINKQLAKEGMIKE